MGECLQEQEKSDEASVEVVREVITGGTPWQRDRETAKGEMTETSRQTEVHLLISLRDSPWPLLAGANPSIHPSTLENPGKDASSLQWPP